MAEIEKGANDVSQQENILLTFLACLLSQFLRMELSKINVRAEGFQLIISHYFQTIDIFEELLKTDDNWSQSKGIAWKFVIRISELHIFIIVLLQSLDLLFIATAELNWRVLIFSEGANMVRETLWVFVGSKAFGEGVI